MKQNKYDDDVFFEKYSGMSRSTEGLAGAGEWHMLRAMLPDFKGKRVLDLGCGFGWHCRYAAEHGATYVLGIDLSAKMLERAEKENKLPGVEYRRAAVEDVREPDASFDVVLSSLAFHYITDFKALSRNVARMLAPEGSFVFSVEHPVFTAEGSQRWVTDDKGNNLHWPVDRYFDEGARDASFLGEDVVKYHKTFTTYVNTLLQNGFALKEIQEAQPDESMLGIPGMADELRRPMMLLVSAVRA